MDGIDNMISDELKVICYSILGVFLLLIAIFVSVDYWRGTAKASLIKKQTGIEYTWREAAQIKNMYDQNNVRIIFDGDEKK